MRIDNSTSLVETYRKSDPDQRTALFLGYPTLRPDFLAIDMADYRAYRNTTSVKQKKSTSMIKWRPSMKRALRFVSSKQ